MHHAVSITRIARRTLDVLLLLLIVLVVATMLVARGIPAVIGGTTFVVAGGSMEPTLPLGAAVVVAPVAASDLAVGDIVSLRAGEHHAVFTHRIARLADHDGSPWIGTRGDANAAADPSLAPATDVIGRLVFFVPLLGYLVMAVGSLQGLMFMVSLGVLLLAGAWILETLEDDLAVFDAAWRGRRVRAAVAGSRDGAGRAWLMRRAGPGQVQYMCRGPVHARFGGRCGRAPSAREVMAERYSPRAGRARKIRSSRRRCTRRRTTWPRPGDI